MVEGRVYKVIAKHTDDVYIGSTMGKYASQRMANHRFNAKNGMGNYGYLFCNPKSPPWMEILEVCQVDHSDILRMKEREYIEAEPNAVNLRFAYLTPEESKAHAKKAVDKYQKTDKGKIAMAKSAHHQSMKRYKGQIDLLEEKLWDSEQEKNKWYEAYKNECNGNIDLISDLNCEIEDLKTKLEQVKNKIIKLKTSQIKSEVE
jgi:hypothetical protein